MGDEKDNLHSLPMGMENAAAMLENRLTVPQALQDKIRIGPNNSNPEPIFKKNRNICSQKTYAHSSIILNSQK